MSTLGTILVTLGADPGPLLRGLKEGESAVQNFGKAAKQAGETLTRNVTLPILAAGGAALKVSGDFNRSFSEIEGLVGITGDALAELRQATLDLAPAVGKGPVELADALFFVTSAGLEGKAAIDALEQSAKASAGGLGTTASVADAVTSAINSYGAANLDAARATDVLTATVREGKLEAASLAPQLGRLLPLAAELGVRFDEVGAAFSVFSRSTGSAELSATQLTGILSKLIGPTETGAKALAALGLSAEDLRSSIRENGLLETLVDLREKVDASGGNAGETFKQIFEEVNAVNGVLQLTGENADGAREIFDSLANSVGATDAAFAAAAGQNGFQFRQGLVALQSAGIALGEALGDVLAPAVKQAADVLARATESFRAAPESTQRLIVQLGLVAAAAGPVLVAVGSLTLALPALGAAITLATGPIGITIGFLAAAALAYDNYTKRSREATAEMGLQASASQRLGNELPTLGEAIGGLNVLLTKGANVLDVVRLGLREFATLIRERVIDAVADLVQPLASLSGGAFSLTAKLRELQQNARLDFSQVRAELAATTATTTRAAAAYRDYLAALKTQGLDGLITNLGGGPGTTTPETPETPVIPEFDLSGLKAATEETKKLGAEVRTVADVSEDLRANLARIGAEGALSNEIDKARSRAQALQSAFEEAFKIAGSLTAPVAALRAEAEAARAVFVALSNTKPIKVLGPEALGLAAFAVNAKGEIVGLQRATIEVVDALEDVAGSSRALPTLSARAGAAANALGSLGEFGRVTFRALQEGVLGAANALSDGLFGAVVSVGDALRYGGSADFTLDMLNATDAIARLDEELADGSITAERYNAEMAVARERLREIAVAASPLRSAARGVGEAFKSAMGEVVSSITKALIKLAAFKTLSFGLNLLFPGAGALLSSGSSLFSTVTSTPVAPTVSPQVAANAASVRFGAPSVDVQGGIYIPASVVGTSGVRFSQAQDASGAGLPNVGGVVSRV